MSKKRYEEKKEVLDKPNAFKDYFAKGSGQRGNMRMKKEKQENT